MKFRQYLAILLSISVLGYSDRSACCATELDNIDKDSVFRLENQLNSRQAEIDREMAAFVLSTKKANYEIYTKAEEQKASIERLERITVEAAAIEESDAMKSAEAEKQEAIRQEQERQQSIKLERQVVFQQEQERLAQDALVAAKYDLTVEEYRICMSAPENVPNENPECKSDKKTYMDYRSVTHQNTNQYKLLNSRWCYTDPYTGIRMFDGRYCIAVGSYYTTKIGTKIDVVLEGGGIIRCVLGDCKSDSHTDSMHQYHTGGWDRGRWWPADGSVVEFVVDGNVFDSGGTGTVNYSSMQGKVVKVVVLDEGVSF